MRTILRCLGLLAALAVAQPASALTGAPPRKPDARGTPQAPEDLPAARRPPAPGGTDFRVAGATADGGVILRTPRGQAVYWDAAQRLKQFYRAVAAAREHGAGWAPTAGTPGGMTEDGLLVVLNRDPVPSAPVRRESERPPARHAQHTAQRDRTGR